MLLAYVPNIRDQNGLPTLCLIPDKQDKFSDPVPLNCLTPDSGAVYHIGSGESVKVYTENNDVVIEPVRPAILYLTPDLPERPGYRVDRIKVQPRGDNRYHVFYDRDRQGWSVWSSNTEKI